MTLFTRGTMRTLLSGGLLCAGFLAYAQSIHSAEDASLIVGKIDASITTTESQIQRGRLDIKRYGDRFMEKATSAKIIWTDRTGVLRKTMEVECPVANEQETVSCTRSITYHNYETTRVIISQHVKAPNVEAAAAAKRFEDESRYYYANGITVATRERKEPGDAVGAAVNIPQEPWPHQGEKVVVIVTFVIGILGTIAVIALGVEKRRMVPTEIVFTLIGIYVSVIGVGFLANWARVALHPTFPAENLFIDLELFLGLIMVAAGLVWILFMTPLRRIIREDMDRATGS